MKQIFRIIKVLVVGASIVSEALSLTMFVLIFTGSKLDRVVTIHNPAMPYIGPGVLIPIVMLGLFLIADPDFLKSQPKPTKKRQLEINLTKG